MSIQALMKQENKLTFLEDVRGKIHVLPTSPKPLVARAEKLDAEIEALRNLLDNGYKEMNQILDGTYE